jgi:hypothetical protein
MEEHDENDDHMEEHDENDDHDHDDDDHDDDDHGHGHGDEHVFTELDDWIEMRMDFDSMPEPPAGMTESVGVPVSASWSGGIEGTINPSHDDEFSAPEIELNLGEDATMHGNVTMQSSESGHRERVHHLDAYDVTGSTFASPDDDENRMTGTFYGADHGTVAGTVNTQAVIGTFQAEKTESTP